MSVTKTAEEIADELHEYAYNMMAQAIALWLIAEMLTTKENNNA